jgi:hypothetical protein
VEAGSRVLLLSGTTTGACFSNAAVEDDPSDNRFCGAEHTHSEHNNIE